jgi:hypothetical protein
MPTTVTVVRDGPSVRSMIRASPISGGSSSASPAKSPPQYADQPTPVRRHNSATFVGAPSDSTVSSRTLRVAVYVTLAGNAGPV